jgi:hypothetical protein
MLRTLGQANLKMKVKYIRIVYLLEIPQGPNKSRVRFSSRFGKWLLEWNSLNDKIDYLWRKFKTPIVPFSYVDVSHVMFFHQ